MHQQKTIKWTRKEKIIRKTYTLTQQQQHTKCWRKRFREYFHFSFNFIFIRKAETTCCIRHHQMSSKQIIWQHSRNFSDWIFISVSAFQFVEYYYGVASDALYMLATRYDTIHTRFKFTHTHTHKAIYVRTAADQVIEISFAQMDVFLLAFSWNESIKYAV